MYILKNKIFFYSQYILLFAVSYLYSYGINSHFYPAWIALFFTMSILCFFLYNLNISEYFSKSPRWYASLLILMMCGGILSAFYVLDGNALLLWPADALDQHLPKALTMLDMLQGNRDIFIIDVKNPLDKIYISNIYVAVFFYLFGVTPIVSSIAMMVLKIATAYLIYETAKKIFDQKIAIVAILIYALMPTGTFYTLQFYKEAFIQFCIALFLFAVTLEKKKIRIILLFLVMSILVIERFYLVPMLLLGLIFYYKPHTYTLFLSVVFTGIIGIIIYYFYFHAYFETVSIDSLWQVFVKLQEGYASGDKNITPNQGFFIDFFRILFTPFLNQYKILHYTGYDSLLIWGSILNQLVIGCYLYGVYLVRKQSIVYINISFLCFLLLFQYIGPFNGRVRDSFYPLIAIFAAAALSKLLNKTQKLN